MPLNDEHQTVIEALKIHFRSKSARKIFENHREGDKKLGPAFAKSRRRRLAIQLDKKNRLIFIATDQPISDWDPDWSQVDGILIIEKNSRSSERHGFAPDWTSAPGDAVSGLMKESGWNQVQLSGRLGVSKKQLNRLV